jgi:hypothetical protein
MKNILILSACVFTISVLFLSCKDENVAGKGTINVRLHDLPIEYDSVNVEIIGVKVHHDDQGWISLPTTIGVYNLLDFQEGIDTLIVPDTAIPSGHISQLRMLLGDLNYVVIDGISFPLELSSQDESGLKLNIHQEINTDEDYTIVVDFDASQSVILNGNGTYRLKPVLTAEIQ